MCYTIETIPRLFHSLISAIDDQRMEIEYQNQDDAVSDSKSCVSGLANSSDLFHGGLAMLDEDEAKAYNVIKQRLISSLASDSCPGSSWWRFTGGIGLVASAAQAKSQSFQIHRRLLEKQAPQDVNLKLAWFGISRAGVELIIFHGFGLSELNQPVDCTAMEFISLLMIPHVRVCNQLMWMRMS